MKDKPKPPTKKQIDEAVRILNHVLNTEPGYEAGRLARVLKRIRAGHEWWRVGKP